MRVLLTIAIVFAASIAAAHDSKDRVVLLKHIGERINQACATEAISADECRVMKGKVVILKKNAITVGDTELNAIAKMDEISMFSYGTALNEKARRAHSDLLMAVALVRATWAHVPRDHGGKWANHTKDCEIPGYGLLVQKGKYVLVPPPHLAGKQ